MFNYVQDNKMFALTLLLFMPVWTAANSGNECIMKNRDRQLYVHNDRFIYSYCTIK